MGDRRHGEKRDSGRDEPDEADHVAALLFLAHACDRQGSVCRLNARSARGVPKASPLVLIRSGFRLVISRQNGLSLQIASPLLIPAMSPCAGLVEHTAELRAVGRRLPLQLRDAGAGAVFVLLAGATADPAGALDNPAPTKPALGQLDDAVQMLKE